MLQTTLRIITYNTHLFGGTLAGITERYKDAERREAIATFVRKSGADIVCLCEVWHNEDKRTLIETSGYPHGYFVPSSKGSMADGLVVLSKFPLSEKQFTPFSSLSGLDGYSAKGVLAVVVGLDDSRSIRLFFTHTQADSVHRETRQHNIAQIRDQVAAFHPGLPAVILGDLNVDRYEYPSLMEALPDFEDAYRLVHPDAGSDPGYTLDTAWNTLAKRFCKDENSDRLDYILISRGQWTASEAKVINNWEFKDPEDGTQDCSDHYPLQATLTLK